MQRRRPGEFGTGGGGRKFTPRRKVCQFCADKIKEVDYKDLGRLRRFLSERGKIEPRRKTGTCAAHQRSLNVALKRARHLALLPFTAEHIRVTGVLVREPGSSPFGRGRGIRRDDTEVGGGAEATEGVTDAAATSAPEAAAADGQPAAAPSADGTAGTVADSTPNGAVAPPAPAASS
jgi:small subunit ribosomal protein S18